MSKKHRKANRARKRGIRVEQYHGENIHHCLWMRRRWARVEYAKLLRETAIAQSLIDANSHAEIHRMMPNGIPVPPEKVAYDALMRTINAREQGLIHESDHIETKLEFLSDALPYGETKAGIDKELWIVHNDPILGKEKNETKK